MSVDSWVFWALLSAVFAALTAIFAKVGIENINSDYATLIRTIIIVLVLAAQSLPPPVNCARLPMHRPEDLAVLDAVGARHWARHGSAISARSSSARRRRSRRSTSSVSCWLRSSASSSLAKSWPRSIGSAWR
jgi:hypothetical protein